jgi:membrane protein DedA with SNARE-associated domain
MEFFLTSLLSYLLLYKYVAIFVIVFLSGLILPLPSNTMLLAAGAFASQGYLNIAAVFFSALIANVFGDVCGYLLTRVWGTGIVSYEKISRFAYVDRADRFVRNHEGLTIFVSRFLGALGVLVNFLSGLIKVPLWSFVFYDVMGNALDTAFFIGIGYGFGVYTENYSDLAQLAGSIVIIVAILSMLVKAYLKKGTKK